MNKIKQADLDKWLDKKLNHVNVVGRFTRPMAGGQPATPDGLKAFVEHHLGLDPDSNEFIEAIRRINGEEIDTRPKDGELQTDEIYQVNVVRKSDGRPYILDHMIKACIKVGATRIGLFKAKIGTKGDVSELGRVTAIKDSLQEKSRPWEIHLRNGNGDKAHTYFEPVTGCVSTAGGKKSICTHTEFADEGSTFAFRFSWMPTKLTNDDVQQLIALATQIGIGSVRSLGYSRWEVVEMWFDEDNRRPLPAKPKPRKKKKKSE